jgi:hypothetical protein
MALNVITNPSFGVIDIDVGVVGSVLEAFVARGSKLTGVSLDDITLGVTEMPPNNANVDLEWLLTHGVKLFDAIIWLTANRPNTHRLQVDTAITPDMIPSMHEIARSVFYTYFFLLTQARYPSTSGQTGKPKVANFLTNVMGMAEDQSVYIERICSFTPQKFDPQWIRNISFTGMGQETLSRFGLGVAGYRMFGPFKLYTPTQPIPAGLQPAYDFACNVARAPASWDVHPSTRNPEILTRRGNLNKNLGNLILKIFSAEEIAEMVTAKVIYSVPVEEKSHRNYTTWQAVDDISGTHAIFRITQS